MNISFFLNVNATYELTILLRKLYSHEKKVKITHYFYFQTLVTIIIIKQPNIEVVHVIKNFPHANCASKVI